jgi:hypothetical protein
MSGELVQRTSDVVSGASVGVLVGVDAIGRSVGSLVITISFIIRIIAIVPPTVTCRVTIYLANLATYINKGSRGTVWVPLAPSITAPGLITVPIITTWLITAPIIKAPVITTQLIAAPIIIIMDIMCRN